MNAVQSGLVAWRPYTRYYRCGVCQGVSMTFDGLPDGSLGFGGDKSAGASFARLDSSV
jgi:phosphoglucomutase